GSEAARQRAGRTTPGENACQPRASLGRLHRRRADRGPSPIGGRDRGSVQLDSIRSAPPSTSGCQGRAFAGGALRIESLTLCAGSPLMVTDQRVGDLWRRVDASSVRPSWRDSPSVSGFRSYGGGDAVPRFDGDVFRVSVRGYRPFVVVFACLFLPASALVAWLM